MPPRSEDELDPVTLHNQALMHMDTDPTAVRPHLVSPCLFGLLPAPICWLLHPILVVAASCRACTFAPGLTGAMRMSLTATAQGFRKLNFLLTMPPFPAETFGACQCPVWRVGSGSKISASLPL
jgi:hypothetical protein